MGGLELKPQTSKGSDVDKCDLGWCGQMAGECTQKDRQGARSIYLACFRFASYTRIRLWSIMAQFGIRALRWNMICTLEQAPYDEAFICDVMKQTLRDARSAIQNCREIHWNEMTNSRSLLVLNKIFQHNRIDSLMLCIFMQCLIEAEGIGLHAQEALLT